MRTAFEKWACISSSPISQILDFCRCKIILKIQARIGFEVEQHLGLKVKLVIEELKKNRAMKTENIPDVDINQNVLMMRDWVLQ
jgi:hypothetical protein